MPDDGHGTSDARVAVTRPLACACEEQPWRAARRVLDLLRAAGHEAWFVGGCVRDLLLARAVQDVDVATDARPDRVEAVFADAGLKTLAVGKAFGVILVVLDGLEVEVATFRNDRAYIDGRHPSGVEFATAGEDVRRRDFTVNALLLDPVAGVVVDHVGGLADLDARLLRAVGVASERLREDRLRVLRCLRFAAALAFEIEKSTWDAVAATELSGLSGERIVEEWAKALRGSGRGRWLRLSRDSGRLADWCGPLAAIAEDAAERSAARLEALPRGADPLVAHAVCCAEADPAALAAWLEAQPLPRRFVERLRWLLRHGRDLSTVGGMALPERRRLLQQPDADLLAQLATALHGAAAAEALSQAVRAESASGPFRPHLRAADLVALGFAPGPALGRALRALEDAQLAGELPDRAAAVAVARRLLAESGRG